MLRPRQGGGRAGLKGRPARQLKRGRLTAQARLLAGGEEGAACTPSSPAADSWINFARLYIALHSQSAQYYALK